jgi:hypothetical protein
LKIFLYLRLLIFFEAAAAFNFPLPFEALMYGLDCRNNTFSHICQVSDSGAGNAGALSCRKLYSYLNNLKRYGICDRIINTFKEN